MLKNRGKEISAMRESFRRDYKSLLEENPGGKISRVTQGELYDRYKRQGMEVSDMAKITMEVSGKKDAKLESEIRKINLCIEAYEEACEKEVKDDMSKGESKVEKEEMTAQNSDSEIVDNGQEVEVKEQVSSEEEDKDIQVAPTEKVSIAEPPAESSDTDERAESWEKEFPTAEVRMISRDKLVNAPDDWNFFHPLSDERLGELVLSIERYGIQHNLVVQEDDDGKFIILSGHQRVRACDILFEKDSDEKYQKFPCRIYKKGELKEEDARRIVIFTNTAQRGDLSLEDRVRSVEELTKLEKVKAFYGSGEDVKKKVSEILGVSRSAVFRLQNLSSLDKDLLAICGNKSEGKKISVREGEVLSKLTSAQQEHIKGKEYYKELTSSRLSALKNLSAEASNDDIDEIFETEKEHRYSIVTTEERPDGYETIGVHVKVDDRDLLNSLRQVIADDGVLADNVKELLEAVIKELDNKSSAISADENKKDAEE